jgi:putative oxidoreductase
MPLCMSVLAPYEPRLRSLVRIAVGFTFSLHGWQKLFGAFGGLGGFRPPLSSMLGAAGVIETIGGALIILGLFTRPVAFLLAGEMAIGYFRTHAPRGFWPLTNGGELAVFYCFFYLWLSAAGAGPWSLDRVFGKTS